MNSFSGVENISPEEAKLEAQKLAFAPFAFQATKIARDRGILKAIEDGGIEGVTINEIITKVSMNQYGISILLDAAQSIGLLINKKDKWVLTKTGYFILHDKITNVNMNFTNDVCYQGLFHLEKSIDNQKPEGLKMLGEWETIYEGLSSLPEQVKKSWFDFDHYFSDSSFPKAIPIILGDKPKKLLDIGGNTGKFAIMCAAYDKNIEITIADLPSQTHVAEKNIEEANLKDRINCHTINLLDHSKEFPKEYDAVWMSQFLDCFKPEDIVSILKRAKRALSPDGILYIMETFVDNQRFPISKYCLDMTSLYFTALANGKSRMYHSTDMLSFIEEAGLNPIKIMDRVGLSHSIIKCR